MKINDVEKLLGISKANIRFYEKEGLVSPARSDNGYRDYSDGDVDRLKDIIILRKLGVSVEDIGRIFSGELALPDALEANSAELERQIENLQGALRLSRQMAAEAPAEVDTERYWEMIREREEDGEEFGDILNDHRSFFRFLFLSVFRGKHVFLGVDGKIIWTKALVFVLIICIVQGIGRKFIWQESFFEGFFHPILVFLMGSAVLLPIFLLNKVSGKAARIYAGVLFGIGMAIIAFILLLFIWGIGSAVIGIFR